MQFDFTSMIDRRGKDAIAVEGLGENSWGIAPEEPQEGFDFIPMWVADMNFATCPAVTEAILARAAHPLFGYFAQRPEYCERIIQWQTQRHGHTGLAAKHIGYENGVHGCLTSAVNILTCPQEKILLHRPTYIGFAADVDRQGRVPVYSELIRDENGVYRMNFEDMERKLAEHHIHTVIFCSPHNPTGRVWEQWELEKAMELFEKYRCFVISDEIWADLTFAGHPHIPTQMVSDWAKQHTIAAYALSKTFNLAGMAASYHIVYSDYLRDRLNHFSARTNYNSQNVLTMHALLGAYSSTGCAWVDELNAVLENNCRYLTGLLNSIDGIQVTMPEGTYMLFADLSGYCARTGKSRREILRAGWRVGVGWQDGAPFGGSCHIRINTALPFSRIQEAGRRMIEYIFDEPPLRKNISNGDRSRLVLA